MGPARGLAAVSLTGWAAGHPPQALRTREPAPVWAASPACTSKATVVRWAGASRMRGSQPQTPWVQPAQMQCQGGHAALCPSKHGAARSRARAGPHRGPQTRVPCASSTTSRKPWRSFRAASAPRSAKSPAHTSPGLAACQSSGPAAEAPGSARLARAPAGTGMSHAQQRRPVRATARCAAGLCAGGSLHPPRLTIHAEERVGHNQLARP